MKLRLLTISLICLTIAAGCREKDDGTSKKQLADFRLDSLDHTRFYLNDYRGKVVVLAFWATWCNPCKTELTALKSLTSRYNDVVLAAVCVDPENIADIKSIKDNLQIEYPILLDQQAGMFNKLNLSAVPSTIIVDRAGSTILCRQGFDDAVMQQIHKSIEQMLTDGEENQ